MKLISIHDGHTASAAYMEDGEVKFAIQEERLTKVKNAGGFPVNSVKEILKRHNLKIDEIDSFVFCGTERPSYGTTSRENYLKKYENLFKFETSYKDNFSKKIKKIIKKIIGYKSKSFYSTKIDSFLDKSIIELGIDTNKIKSIDHHFAHASTAGYGWGLNEKFVVITSDSAGDGISGSVWVFENGTMEKKATIPVSDSIARLYSLITYYMGMVPMEHEYKIMGLAAYAEDSIVAKGISDYFYDLFEFDQNGLVYKRKNGVEPVYEFAPRLKEYLAYKRFDLVSAGLQLFIERIGTEWVSNVLNTLNLNKVALAGGLFMNVKLNKKIGELKAVKDMFVFPSCGDESNVFGALYSEWFHLTKKNPLPISSYYLGGEFNQSSVEIAIKDFNFKKSKIKHNFFENIEIKIAELLSEKKIVARYNGRMEFGARALGNRSILANASDHESIKVINKMIKSRDFWMPFAPSMIESENYIINPKKIKSPYMMMAYDVIPNKISKMTAGIHPYDETCRAQEVYKEWNSSYYNIINEYKNLTGESVILNTSFNLHGYPVVYTPEDALYVFDNSGLNFLAMGNILIEKI